MSLVSKAHIVGHYKHCLRSKGYWSPMLKQADIQVVAWCFARRFFKMLLYYSTDITQEYKLVAPLYNHSLQRHLESASPLLGPKHLFFSVPQRFEALFSLHLLSHYRTLPHCHMVEVVQWFACYGVFLQCCRCMEPFLLEGSSCMYVPEM